ncbi:hypothetical protein [Streptomyces sp. NPDC017964]|uniref:hypothetical protein n=1 Tax=Streptomyces sp. NPDC017964 TaxID=3365022 RepID=UPI0037ADF008
MRSAAAAWLAGHGEQASFEYARTAGEPIGSVVDIRWQHGALRIHLDQAVAPVWDNGMEPVLGMGVPVDRDTLIRRWYVHRIRLESQGTTRQVRIGTEAFAGTTEWFGLEDCEVTINGLSTPAVQRIIQARSAPSPAKWTPGKKQDTAQDTRAQDLLRRLLYARRTGSITLADSACREITELTGSACGSRTNWMPLSARDASGSRRKSQPAGDCSPAWSRRWPSSGSGRSRSSCGTPRRPPRTTAPRMRTG